MFVEKLKTGDINFIFRETVKVVGSTGYEPRILNITKKKDYITVNHKPGLEDQDLYISDFKATYTWGSYDSAEKVHKVFLKCMYNIFGEKYIEAYKEYIKNEHNQKVANFMDKEYAEYAQKVDEIDEITK